MKTSLIHIPQAPGARSARSCAPRAWTRDATRLSARGAVAPSGPAGPPPLPTDDSSAAGRARRREETSTPRLPRSPATRKLRALWISAFHLGIAHERSDAALAAWIGRRTGLDAAAAPPETLAPAAQALEAWLARAAGVDWRPYLSLGRNGHVRETRRPRARVLEAQWRLLHREGLVRIGSLAALGSYAARHARLGRADTHLALSAAQADALIGHFGRRLRKAREERNPAADAPPTAREARIGRRRAAAEANARRAQALFEKETTH